MKYKQLSIEEREFIQLGLWGKKSMRSIAKELGRDSGTLSRELTKNLSGRNIYTPRAAHQRALTKRKSRGRKNRLKNDIVRTYVVKELKKRTSPEQIAGRISVERPGQRISHEAIYQFIYHQIHRDGWGLLKPGCEDLRPFLRRRKKRRTRKGMRRCQKMPSTIKGPSIDLRPEIVEARARIGDWESDTVESRDHKPGINTLVERKTGLVLITKLKSKNSEATVLAIESRVENLPEKLRQTATFDNGFENQKWEKLEKRTGLKCFFAHAYHSWERGTNENTNGLIRDFFPKKTDFTTVFNEELRYVENNLNNRPRKRLGWKTPLEVFSKELNKFKITINMPSVAVAG